ncbi:hypothetical protein BABINDRAFT_8310 [Babjeviella inositovora NRRL Y-12698]|uniref:Putative 5'-nucleotidase C-terminal domain-containing protein n=1 Tax=Babjeviella inositovora NRRL Y-12698 TaxID=984486 RepID=A0A1E3QNT0_9ASCO|nr:uncharacterized protein BABINDRAFT_8310 [Babjeviella inositovora NRRL Y-12698]ODQ79366.1 hypothetical protein BABINDRAFT_8310 [Babjeviella inositovora NRRL Y-12698]
MSEFKLRSDEAITPPTWTLRDIQYLPRDTATDTLETAKYGLILGSLAGYAKYNSRNNLTSAKAPLVFLPKGITAKLLFDALLVSARSGFTVGVGAGIFQFTKSVSSNLREKDDSRNTFYGAMSGIAFGAAAAGKGPAFIVSTSLLCASAAAFVDWTGGWGTPEASIKRDLFAMQPYDARTDEVKETQGRWEVVGRKPFSAAQEYFGKDSILFRVSVLLVTIVCYFSKSPTAPATEAPLHPLRPLRWGHLNFLHTTDTHGWYAGHFNQKQYSANWGDFVSFALHMRSHADAARSDLLLIDTGDKHDGNGLSDATAPNGLISTPIFIKQDYDLITLGNHELYLAESSIQEYEQVASHFGDRYVGTNVDFIMENGTAVPFGSRYRYFQTPNRGLNVLALGVLFDFNRFNERTVVHPISELVQQEWFVQSMLDFLHEPVDVIVVFGHIPVSHDWWELTLLHGELRKYFPDTKIQYFGGHSHIRDFSVFDDNSTALQAGRFCETVGWLSVNFTGENDLKGTYDRKYIDFNLNSFMFHSKKTLETFHTRTGLELTTHIAQKRRDLGLETVLGQVHRNYFMDYVPFSHPRNIYHMLSTTILPTLKVSSDASHSRIIIINTGSVRYDLYKGPYTKDTNFIVSPFKNNWNYIPQVPRSLALKIEEKLNNQSYILSRATAKEVDLLRLLPPHKSSRLMKEGANGRITPDGLNDITEQQYLAIAHQKLSKGYVTHDDFGEDGDDTIHIPRIEFPIPNVAVAKQLSGDDTVDVVFYDFIQPYILWALAELTVGQVKKDFLPHFYGNETISGLLQAYVQNVGDL